MWGLFLRLTLLLLLLLNDLRPWRGFVDDVGSGVFVGLHRKAQITALQAFELGASHRIGCAPGLGREFCGFYAILTRH